MKLNNKSISSTFNHNSCKLNAYNEVKWEEIELDLLSIDFFYDNKELKKSEFEPPTTKSSTMNQNPTNPTWYQ